MSKLTHWRSAPPILVTGIPRSGTTWLARLLASAPRTALSGREPMNPRGRQYALAHTLSGWVRLQDPSPRQRRALATTYRGLNPWVYSRYGRRQWAAPLPGTRHIIKDPFALLSIPAVQRFTHARTVVTYRHPGAVLVSYRRMGWSPDVEELSEILDTTGGGSEYGKRTNLNPASPRDSDDVETMAWFWNALHALVLADRDSVRDLTIVSHHEFALHGEEAGQILFSHLDLTWTDAGASEFQRPDAPTQAHRGTELHTFNRAPSRVAEEWRASLSKEEIATIEELTAPMRRALRAKRLPLGRGIRSGL